MDIEVYKEAVSNADMSFNNENYENAVLWFDKALAEAPTDEYALSKAGAALVASGRFEEAFGYFERAVAADPDNGDNYFNLANAYFFSGDIGKAMEYYTEADARVCSDDVKARIYYQLALMCSIKEDYKAALVNYQKYEDADKTGQAALDTDILADKVEICIKLEDYDNAIKYASRWLNLAPSDIRCYMIYFNMMMATEQYERALKTLDDALKYAVTDDAGKYAVEVSRASYFVAAAGTYADTEGDYEQKAYDLMNELVMSDQGSPYDKNELVLALGELCIKMGKVDEAIQLMQVITEQSDSDSAPAKKSEERKLDPAEIDAMMSGDLQKMDSMIQSGELDENIGENVPVSYDENGNPVRDFPDELFSEDGVKLPDFKEFSDAAAAEAAEAEAMIRAQKEKVNYMLLSCYAYKEDYVNALEYAHRVRNSDSNIYYSFFGRYSEAFCMMQLSKRGEKFTREEADNRYNEEIAFFRAEMLKRNESSAYALIFRTRMYAEMGKFDKAAELAELMAEDDRESVKQYIEDCRRELSGS